MPTVTYLFLHLIISTWKNWGLLLGMVKWPGFCCFLQPNLG